jgi:hypothetical protein
MHNQCLTFYHRQNCRGDFICNCTALYFKFTIGKIYGPAGSWWANQALPALAMALPRARLPPTCVRLLTLVEHNSFRPFPGLCCVDPLRYRCAMVTEKFFLAVCSAWLIVVASGQVAPLAVMGPGFVCGWTDSSADPSLHFCVNIQKNPTELTSIKYTLKFISSAMVQGVSMYKKRRIDLDGVLPIHHKHWYCTK